MVNQFAVFIAAFGLSLVMTPVAKRAALQLQIIDHPGPRKIHIVPIPLLGGIAIYTAAVIAFLLFKDGTPRSQVVAILAGATFLTMVGVLDDSQRLHHQVKLLLGMPFAALLLLIGGIQATFLPHPVLNLCWTLLWVVGVTGSISILDHMDGLVAGTAAIATAFFLICAILGEQYLVSILAAAVLGASLGFLRYNFNPASIFMGDAGALFVGFVLAVLGLKTRVPWQLDNISWMVPVLILAVPIFDTTLVTISRLRRGIVPFASPGKDHTAHRLSNLGLGQRGAVLALYSLGILFGLLALLLSYLTVWQGYAMGATILAGAVLAIIGLEHAPYEHQGTRGT